MARNSSGADAPVTPILLNAPQVAALLGIDRSTVWRWRASGVLPKPTVEFGHCVRWSREGLEKFARGEATA